MDDPRRYRLTPLHNIRAIALLCFCGSSAAACGEVASGELSRSPCTLAASETGPTCAGARAPRWELRDIQPQSDRFGEVYGLSGFAGRPLLVALLSAW